MASLNKPQTVSDIVAALKVLNPEITGAAEAQITVYWTAIINALYDRITSDLQMELNTDVVAAGSMTANGFPVLGTGILNDKVSTVV